MRSLVTPNFFPTSSSVLGFPPSRPKRWKMIFFSRSSKTSNRPPTSLRRFLSRSSSNGVCASSSPTISPNSVESSSLIAEFIVGRFAAKLFAHLQRHATHFGDFVHKMHRQPDGFALVRQCSLDGLLNPPGGISAQLSAFCRIEPLHRLH